MKSDVYRPKCKFIKKCVTLFTSVFFLHLFASCQEIKKTHNNVLSQKDLEFKHWLKDTLKIINGISIKEYKQTVKIGSDSLSLELIKTNNFEVDKYSKNNKEVIYALDLLERNGIMPTQKFHLELVIGYYFFVSPVEQIKRGSDTEIKRFVVWHDNRKTEYKFVKGNLIDKIESKN